MATTTTAAEPARRPDRTIRDRDSDGAAVEVRIYRDASGVTHIVAEGERTWVIEVADNVGRVQRDASVPTWVREVGYQLGLAEVRAP